jgi:hypothetical protein
VSTFERSYIQKTVEQKESIKVRYSENENHISEIIYKTTKLQVAAPGS